MGVTRAVIGVDVGGTNTDAVILDKSDVKLRIIAQTKTETTADITTGVNRAIHLVLIAARKESKTLAIQQVNIGTTHFINAVVEGKDLAKVSVVRLCGTASRKLIPFSDFPEKLTKSVCASIYMLNGGYQFDGKEITPVDENEVKNCADIMRANGERNIVVSGIFSPVRDEQERRVVKIIKELFPEASITASCDVGKLGLLGRENAAILNECIKPLFLKTIRGIRAALDDIGLKCPIYFTQNDGTILSEEKARDFPVLLFASGATNSMRGAAFLSGLKDAIVVDIGGTSTDVGLLLKGFPREASSEVKVGGIRTNFRMPDVISIGVGGGSYVDTVTVQGKEEVRVGPLSAGYRIKDEALVFAQPGEITDRVVTATDIAVAAGYSDVAGLKSNVKHLDKTFVNKAEDKIHEKIRICVDQMRFNYRNLPLILVGGGSIIVDRNREFKGVSQVILPQHFDVANAVGAALSQISTSKDKIVDLETYIDTVELNMKIRNELKHFSNVSNKDEAKAKENARKQLLQKARECVMNEMIEITKKETIAAGANPESLTVVEKEDVALSYIPGSATRMKLKVVGDLKMDISGETYSVPRSVYKQKPVVGNQIQKQTVTNTGVIITMEDEYKLEIQTPIVDQDTGEWVVSEYDVECIHIGAGLLGCGGGGNPHLGRILALKALRRGAKIRVVSPSRLLASADPENDLVTLVAFLGAPTVIYEKLVSGKETIGALQCLQDLYRCGDYKDGALENFVGVNIETKDGVKFIDNYQVKGEIDATTKESKTLGKKQIVAIMSAEVGGMNCIEPLIVAAELGLPVLDCDGMGRAFPELQMFAPFIYGNNCYPSALVDDKGRRAVVLHADSPKRMEDHFRKVVVDMGCSAGIVLSHFNKEQVLKHTVHHSLSHAWRLGDTVLRARAEQISPVDAIARAENGKILIYGKVTDIILETTSGFNKGNVKIEGLDNFEGKTVTIDFQNEFLVAFDTSHGAKSVLTCVPDLITLMDADTAQPIPTEEVRFGIRVSAVAIRAPALMSTDQALTFVGPQAFGYSNDVKYKPVCDPVDVEPIPAV